VGSGHVRGSGVGEGGQGEFGGGEVDDGDHLVFVPVAAGAGFGCLDEGVDAFEQSVGQVAESGTNRGCDVRSHVASDDVEEVD